MIMSQQSGVEISEVTGAEVRTGKLPESDDWLVQSVLVPRDVGEQTARTKAKEILSKIED